MKRIVVPGEVLIEKAMRIDNTIVEDGKTCSTVMGLYDDENNSLIPLEGLWYPRPGEKVIGVIEEARLNTYNVNLNAPYKGLIISKYTEGDILNKDIVEASVKELDKTGTIVLVRPRVLQGGKIISVKPSKVPRILGKENTMINQLAQGTKSTISVGVNGLIWMKGGDTDLATDAINRIQEESHVSGLTERINAMLQSASEPK